LTKYWELRESGCEFEKAAPIAGAIEKGGGNGYNSPMLSEYTDKELAALVVSGQSEYFAEIEARYRYKILATVKKYLGSGRCRERDAEDVMQEIWIKIYKSLRNYKPERAGLGTLIYTITENECRDFYRNKWTKRLQSTDFDADMPEQYENDESGAANRPTGDFNDDPVKYYVVKKAMKTMFGRIDKLPELLRNTLILRFVANVSEKEIAAQRGCSVSAVRSNITRASQALVETMRDFQNPEEVAKILCKGSFVFTDKEVERIKDAKVKKFLEFISVRRAPMEKIFKTLKCNTKADRQKLMDSAVEEILKFQRLRKSPKVPPVQLMEALFAGIRQIIDGEKTGKAHSPGVEILRAAKKKKITMDALAEKLGLSVSEIMKMVSGKTDIIKKPALASNIKKHLGIPLSRLRVSADDRLLISLRSKTREDALLDNVRKRVFPKLGIKQI